MWPAGGQECPNSHWKRWHEKGGQHNSIALKVTGMCFSCSRTCSSRLMLWVQVDDLRKDSLPLCPLHFCSTSHNHTHSIYLTKHRWWKLMGRHGTLGRYLYQAPTVRARVPRLNSKKCLQPVISACLPLIFWNLADSNFLYSTTHACFGSVTVKIQMESRGKWATKNHTLYLDHFQVDRGDALPLGKELWYMDLAGHVEAKKVTSACACCLCALCPQTFM